jgi:hypothetical protein
MRALPRALPVELRETGDGDREIVPAAALP